VITAFIHDRAANTCFCRKSGHRVAFTPSPHSASDVARGRLIVVKLPKLIIVAALAVLSGQPSAPGYAEEQSGITHTLLLKSTLPATPDQEVIVWDTVYAPGAINPRHLHPAAITFHVVSGTGVWQEDGKPAVTLHAGDSLFVPAGTIHTHWNPSKTDSLRFVEFIVAEKDKGRSIRLP
jgi:quercetin dioxygenase-like cupin family protein